MSETKSTPMHIEEWPLRGTAALFVDGERVADVHDRKVARQLVAGYNVVLLSGQLGDDVFLELYNAEGAQFDLDHGSEVAIIEKGDMERLEEAETEAIRLRSEQVILRDALIALLDLHGLHAGQCYPDAMRTELAQTCHEQSRTYRALAQAIDALDEERAAQRQEPAGAGEASSDE